MGQPSLEHQKDYFREKLTTVVKQANSVIVDKPVEISLSVSCLIARGHLLIEDRPGMGKTTLVKTLAKLFGLSTQRIQFTNDMLPSDILGTSIFNKSKSEFEFHKGPIFSNFVLADEINRATPKTQSACLQPMEEGLVTIDGKSYELPQPFFLVATQNPTESIGAFALPESQLDRFLMKIKMGFPSRLAERDLLTKKTKDVLEVSEVFKADEVLKLIEEVSKVHISETFLDYTQDVIEQSRIISSGLSPRAGQDLIKASKAWAYTQGRDFAIPEDLQAVAKAVMGHRLFESSGSMANGEELVEEILNAVKVP